MLGKEQDGGPEQVRIGIQCANEDVVDLRQELVRVVAGHLLAFLGERGEIIALLEILAVDYAVLHDSLVLTKEPDKAGR